MNMLKFHLQFLLIGLVFLASSCKTDPHWHTTAEGYYVYDDTDDDLALSWKGDTYLNFVNGKGTLTVFDRHGVEKENNKVSTYYGVPKDWNYIPYESGQYLGEYKKEMPHGLGCLIRNDSILIGEFKKGQLYSGKVQIGIIHGKKGELCYVGKLKKGKYHDSGDLFKNGELVYSGGWENGQKSGLGEEYENGELVYSGAFNKGQRWGFGKSYRNGILEYCGEWKKGEHHGEGTLYNENNIPVYEGEWKEGCYHGDGKLYKDGQCIEGKFDKGRLEREYSVTVFEQIKKTTNRIIRSSDTLVSEDSTFYEETTEIALAANQQEFVDLIMSELSEKAEAEFEKRVDKRFGFWGMFRMNIQPLFRSNITRADKAQQYFCKNLSSEEIEKWINVKIDYFNEHNSEKLHYVEIDDIGPNELVSSNVAKLIFDRESIELADAWIAQIIESIIFLIVLFIGVGTGSPIVIVLNILAFIIELIITFFITSPSSLAIETEIKQALLDNYLIYLNSQDIISQMFGLL